MLVSGGWFRAAGFGRLVWDQPEQNPYSAPDPAQYGYSQYGQTPTQQPQNPYAQPGPPAQAQYPQAQYPQRQYPQAHHAQGQYDPWGQSIQAGWTPSPPPAASGGVRKKAILAGAVAVVVVTGGAVSYVAFQDKNNGGGAGSPQAAVGTIVTSLSKSDLLGVLDDLPPAERASIHDSFVSQVSQLKRLKVLNSSADANKVSGVTFAAKGLTYGASVAVNDHVQHGHDHRRDDFDQRRRRQGSLHQGVRGRRVQRQGTNRVAQPDHRHRQRGGHLRRAAAHRCPEGRRQVVPEPDVHGRCRRGQQRSLGYPHGGRRDRPGRCRFRRSRPRGPSDGHRGHKTGLHEPHRRGSTRTRTRHCTTTAPC